MQVKISYNDNLIKRCILSGINADEFITKFVTNELDDDAKASVKADFERVREQM